MVIDMAKYVIVENGKVVNIAVAEPEFAAEQGWIEHQEGVNTGWSYDGSTFSKPPRDIDAEWAEIRLRRNSLLIQSDVNVLPDRWIAMTTEQQNAWTIYRQALRDIPTTFADPKEVVWPTQPE